ncbi:MAG: ferritin [Ardenticatenales bacterium]|nr:ferritin [Ardenticatenales bacterium]
MAKSTGGDGRAKPRERKLISSTLEAALNAQIGREFGASLEYVSIASYFDRSSLPQLADFFYRQADEEKMHAMKFVHFVNDSGGEVAIPAIPAARHAFVSAEDAVNAALAWEHAVTGHINDLMGTALDERNFIAQQFLQWFVAEQLEEVASIGELLATVERAGEGNLLAVEDYVARRPQAAAEPAP